MAMASSLGNRDAYDGGDLVEATQAARGAVVELGQARPGDKTVLDALDPFVAALKSQVEQKVPIVDALGVAAAAATRAAAGTAPLRPRKGRRRPLADRSVGTPDPGAVSFALIATAAGGRGRSPARQLR